MKRKIKYILLFLTSLLMVRCANVVAPTGGPKDVTPPEVRKAVPENGTVGFNGKRIELTFDEYVTLNNANQEVLFSPPIATKPDVKLSGKTVIIKLKESLKPDATYTIRFGNAVKDLHEGNVFKDYVYTFSTGDHLDTLSMSGKVINADDEKSVDGIFVMLYAESDSVFDQPTSRVPDFITKTDKEGLFRFDGLPDQHFLIFALSDVNSNLIYDMPNEKVAFLDTLVAPSDSVSIKLQAFIEEDTTQMLLEKKLVEEGLLRFVFRRPAEGVEITFSEPTVDTFNMVQVWSKERDTLRCFFTPNVMDSLRVLVQFDTLINDNSNYSLKYRESQRRSGRDNKYIKASANIRNKKLGPDDDFVLSFPEPIVEMRPYDTLRFEQVDDYGMKYRLVTTIDDTTTYTVNLPDSVFFSVRGRTNDTLSFQFKRAQRNDFGNLYIQVQPAEGTQAVIQLLNNRDRVVTQRVIDTLQKVEFLQLSPETYKLRAIIDADRNGKWSTGNYHRIFLPEKIIPYKDNLDIKPAWDMDLEEVWDLSR